MLVESNALICLEVSLITCATAHMACTAAEYLSYILYVLHNF